MLKVALTGGIGSGKTTVARIFELLGVPIYYSDERARELMHTDTELVAQIKSAFGDESYCKGELDRSFLASKVFSDETALDQLNALVHPAVLKDQLKWIATLHSPYCIIESALIFEIKKEDFFDKIITVWAEDELRIKRVMERDKTDRNLVLKRLNSQLDQEIKKSKSDFLIDNNGQLSLIRQVSDIHSKISQL